MLTMSNCFICTVAIILAWTSSLSFPCREALRTRCIYGYVDQISSVLVNDIPPNKQLTIRCDYPGTHRGWSHSPDGSETSELLDTSPFKYTVSGNTLTISNINKSDEGLYHCIYDQGHTKELCLFVYGSAVFASCPLTVGGCTGDPTPLSVTSGGSVIFNATVIHTPGGSCGFKQGVTCVKLRKINPHFGVSSELLLSCTISERTTCSRGRVSLNRGTDSSSESDFIFTLSNVLYGIDSGLYEVTVEGTHPATASLTTITKRFQLEVTAADCGDPVPPQNGSLGHYNSTLQGSRVTYQCAAGRLPIGQFTTVCMNEGKWSPDPALFICTELPPPTGILPLCNVIVWESHEYYCDGILTGYEVQFHASNTQTISVRNVPENKTFYVVQNADKLGGSHNTLIRVRANTSMGAGIWSEEMNLGCAPSNCSIPGLPPSHVTQQCNSVWFSLGDMTYFNNSQVSIESIGEGENALSCWTNRAECCKTSRSGEFFYPNGTMVPIRIIGKGFYRNRGEKVVRLHRMEGIMMPIGKFRCAIPDMSGEVQSLYITLV